MSVKGRLRSICNRATLLAAAPGERHGGQRYAFDVRDGNTANHSVQLHDAGERRCMPQNSIRGGADPRPTIPLCRQGLENTLFGSGVVGCRGNEWPGNGGSKLLPEADVR